MVKANRSADTAAARAAAKTAKQDEKAKARLEKLNKRNEAIFDKALTKFSTTALESDSRLSWGSD